MIVAKQGCYRAAITAERRILSLRSSDVIANVGVSWRAVRTLQYRLRLPCSRGSPIARHNHLSTKAQGAARSFVEARGSHSSRRLREHRTRRSTKFTTQASRTNF